MPNYYGTIQNGKLKLNNPKAFNKEIEKLEGKTIELTIKPKKRTRTLTQNAYYWGAVLPTISDYTGYEVEDLHNHFKYHFLKKKVGNLDSFKSTTQLTKEEFTDYIEKIRRFTEQVLGFHINSPEETGYISN